jgi:hypothetical protein
MYLNGTNYYAIADNTLNTDVLGNTEEYILDYISPGDYTINFEVYDTDNELILLAQKDISVLSTGIDNVLSESNNNNVITIKSYGNRMMNISFTEMENYSLQIFNVDGRLVLNKNFSGTSIDLTLPSNGIYILNIVGEKTNYSNKIIIN